MIIGVLYVLILVIVIILLAPVVIDADGGCDDCAFGALFINHLIREVILLVLPVLVLVRLVAELACFFIELEVLGVRGAIDENEVKISTLSVGVVQGHIAVELSLLL